MAFSFRRHSREHGLPATRAAHADNFSYATNRSAAGMIDAHCRRISRESGHRHAAVLPPNAPIFPHYIID